MLFLPLSLSAQHLSTESADIDCGQVLFGHPVTAVYEMRNSGNLPLTIRAVRTSCGCTTVDWPATAIAAGKNFQITVRYDAQTMGHFDKQIGIESNAADTTMVLSLHGVVVPSLATFVGTYDYQIGDLRLDRNNVEFDDVNRGDKPIQQIHIINKGKQTLQPVVMHLPSYLKAEVKPTQLAPGHSGVVTLMLDSRAIRDFGLTQSSIYLGMFPGSSPTSITSPMPSAPMRQRWFSVTRRLTLDALTARTRKKEYSKSPIPEKVPSRCAPSRCSPQASRWR